jgi:hypothetical protein
MPDAIFAHHNGKWLLKNFLTRPNQQKSDCARMPYKRSSQIPRHSWSPDSPRISDQKEFFNSHAMSQQQPPPNYGVYPRDAGYGLISHTVPQPV